MDWTQIITIYKGPLHIINNYNGTCVRNSKIQYNYNIIINSLKNEKKGDTTKKQKQNTKQKAWNYII